MTAPGVEAVLAEVLAGHADCVLNGNTDLGAYATGQDVWSCGLALPFSDDLEDAERAHVAAEQAKALAVWAQQDEVVERAGDSLDEWLFRMHGLTSSCNHHDEASAVLTAIFGGES